jgi:xanthine dehydrogenase accessory factor
VEIRGGAARALGDHVAVAADGRFCGYVSGGCVEAALAAEALQAIAEGRDRMVKFGEGSPFIDLALPCGGGITLAIHVLRSDREIIEVLAQLSARQPTALSYSPQYQSLVRSEEISKRAQWCGDSFLSVYHPQTRIVICGQSGEAEVVRRLAECSGYDVQVLHNSRMPKALTQEIDCFTAVVLLHHDLDREDGLLTEALISPAFYIGALGSRRTHLRRLERLQALGMAPRDLERVKAPIGMFGPTRDMASLAISVLADIASTRLSSLP